MIVSKLPPLSFPSRSSGNIGVLPLIFAAFMAIVTGLLVYNSQKTNMDMRIRASEVYPPTITPIPTNNCQYRCTDPSACGYQGGTPTSGTCSGINICCKPGNTPTPTVRMTITPTPGNLCKYTCSDPLSCILSGKTIVPGSCSSYSSSICCAPKPTPTPPNPSPTTPAPNSKFNVLILSSGYTDSNEFLNDADHMAHNFVSTAPFNGYNNKGQMIFYYAYTGESFCTTFKIIGKTGVTCDTITVLQKATATNTPYNTIFVIARNMSSLSSSIPGSNIAVLSKENVYENHSPIAAHEFGHSFANLMDEYDYGVPYDEKSPYGPVRLNCAYPASDCDKWKKYPGTGCYKVCTYNNAYRPTNNNIMQCGPGGTYWFAWDYDPVSLDVIRQKIDAIVNQ